MASLSDVADYKRAKEAFVSDNAGDSVWNINKVCWTAIATYQLWTVTSPLLPASFRRGWKLLAYEYCVLVLPVLLGLTLLAEHPVYLNAVIYACVVVAYLASWSRRKSALYQADKQRLAESPASVDFARSDVQSKPRRGESSQSGQTLPRSALHRPFVSVWRAHMMLMTVLCILAVDFPVFPRRFGKCESWGTSLMDLGVGSFVFALGFVVAGPFLLELKTSTRTPAKGNTLSTMKKSVPVLVLGIVRLLMVKGVEYPEHVTEYGVHWNFFFTLALLPVLGAFSDKFWSKAGFRSQALLVTTLHTLCLTMTSLQGNTLSDRRSGLIAANKEGIVSLVGYFAIYLLGKDTGTYTLPPDPYYAYRNSEKAASLKPKIGKLMNVLSSYAVVWWCAFGVVHLHMPASFAASRRLANSAYVLWVASFNVSFLLLYLAVDSVSPRKGAGDQAPAIFQAINKNSLAVFLIANLLTGLVNVSIKTMYATSVQAVLVMFAYSAAVVVFAWLLRHRRLKM